MEGYTKFGSYTGIDNNDGPFIYLGFRPAFVLIKRLTNGGQNWILIDSSINPSNPADTYLIPNDDSIETTSSTRAIDLLANGFKVRGNSSETNGGSDYMYAAFAEHPFGGENAAPATAR